MRYLSRLCRAQARARILNQNQALRTDHFASTVIHAHSRETIEAFLTGIHLSPGISHERDQARSVAKAGNSFEDSRRLSAKAPPLRVHGRLLSIICYNIVEISAQSCRPASFGASQRTSFVHRRTVPWPFNKLSSHVPTMCKHVSNFADDAPRVVFKRCC